MSGTRWLAALLAAVLLPACAPEPAPEVERSAAPAPSGPLLGTRPDLGALRWADEAGDLQAAPFTLVRWWTVQCPFCRDSLPALTALRREFGRERLGLWAVFHRKGPGTPDDAALRGYLQELGVDASLARDDAWQALRPILRDGDLQAATSITLLLDRTGAVRWVHPGPRLHPSGDPEHGSADADFGALREVLRRLLGG